MNKPVALSSLTYRTILWLWRGRIPFGSLTLLAGRTEVGKSTLLSDIAARVSRGCPFPDEEPELGVEGDGAAFRGHREPGRAFIFCTEEDGESSLLARAAEQEGDLRRIHVEEAAFRLDDYYQDLARLLRRNRTERTLLVFDPLSSYLRHQTGQGLRADLQRLNAFVREHGVAAIGVVHLVKGASRTVLAGMRGGGQLSEVARHILALARVTPGDPCSPVLLSVIKSNLTLGDVPHIGFRIEKNRATDRPHLRWLDDDDLPETASIDALVAAAATTGKQSTTKLAQAEAALMRVLADGPVREPAILAALQRETAAGERTVREAKARAGVQSEKRADGWYWRLPTPPVPSDDGNDPALH